MSKPKLKPKLVMEAVVEDKILQISFYLQDFKKRDNDEQKLLRAFVAATAQMINEITETEETV